MHMRHLHKYKSILIEVRWPDARALACRIVAVPAKNTFGPVKSTYVIIRGVYMVEHLDC